MSHPATQLGLPFSRVQSLQLHPDLHLAHLSSSTDLNEGLARRRAWQQTLNCKIQHITLQLLVGIFRYFRARHSVWAWPLSSFPSLSSVSTLPSILPALTLPLSSLATWMAVCKVASWEILPADPVRVCVHWLRAQGPSREGVSLKQLRDSCPFPWDSEAGWCSVRGAQDR